MSYLSIPEAAVLWNTTPDILHRECEKKRIHGAVRFGYRWFIPDDAKRPSGIQMPHSREKAYA